MEYQDWVDLSSYGAQFKRLNLPNGTSVPIVIVQDVEKFNSMATPLENFKQGSQNGIPFETLPGNKKGREFNQPILFMTKSFKELGNTPYAVLPSLAKLLNISDQAVKDLRKPMPVDQVVSDIPYADVEKFAALTNTCFQAYAGNTLYAIKKPTDYDNLVEYAERITETQHPLFPKSNVSNIPFDALDKFGLSTSIIGCAFLNPQDAKKSGYDLSELTRIHLEGEMSILPISLNKDLSINYISNVSEVSQLAYSNYKWKDNIDIIGDYNALVAVHEASRSILNTRPTAIQTPEQLNGLVEKISVTLQNFHESNGVASSHKIIKYFNKGVTSHVIKNDQGEWRYIEKDATKKNDEPLTWANYQKALTTIANYNSILSGALELQVKQGAEFDNAMQAVFKNHHQFYNTNTQVVANLDDVKLDGRLIIHENGKKVHKQQVLGAINAHQRDMGETLYTESVKQLLSGMRSVEDAGNIKNTTGQYVDEFSLQNNVSVVAEPQDNTQDNNDIGLSILDQMAQGQKVDFKREANVEAVSVKPLIDVSPYVELPKGFSDKVDANYEEVNDIYKTLQHIELSQIPYYKNAESKSKEELKGLIERTNNKASASFQDYLKGGDAVFASENEAQALEIHNQIQGLQESADQYDQIIDRARVQANILRYQLNKYLTGIEQPVYGLLALQSDAQGNFKPFEDATAYRTAVKLIQNAFEATNVDGLVARNSELSANLDAFVTQHYAVTAVDPSEPENALATLNQTIDKAQFSSLPVVEQADSLPLLGNDVSTIHTDIAYRVNHSFTKYGSGDPATNSLDLALIAVARYADHIKLSSGVEFAATNNPEFNALLQSFSAYEGSLDYPCLRDFRSPISGVVLGDMTKVEILKAVADKSLSSLDEETLSSHLIQNLSLSTAEARLQAREKIEQTPQQQLMQDMAGQFLVNYQDSLKTSEKPSSDVYYYTVGGDENSFRVMSAENSKVPQGAIALSNSNTLNTAVREAFTAYQVHQTANSLGIAEATLAQIKEIAQNVKNGEHAKVVDLSKSAFGYVLTPADLNSFNFIGATDRRDALGNRLVAVEADDLGLMDLTHDESQKLIDRIGLCQKIAGIESDLRPNPLISLIGDTNEFNKVQKYLMPELEEHGCVSALIRDADNVFDVQQKLPAMVSGFAYTALKNGMSQDVLLNGKQLGLLTNTANNLNDVVYSRLVPVEWSVSFADSGRKDFNFSTFDAVSSEITVDKITEFAANHVHYGVRCRPSMPVILVESTLSNPDILSDQEMSILKQGGGVTDGSVSRIEDFKDLYAATNISAAINNMPQSVISEIRDNLEGKSQVSPMDIIFRVSMTEQDGLNLPRLKFESFGAEMKSGKDFICTYSAHDLKQILEHGGCELDQIGRVPVMLSLNNSNNYLNEMLLERRGFDLQTYLNDVATSRNIAEIKLKDPAVIIDSLPPITIAESQLSKGAIDSNVALWTNIATLKAKEDPELPNQVVPLINNAKVFAQAKNSQVSLALAYSPEKCREYADAGFVAVSPAYSPDHRPVEGYNILEQLDRKIVTADNLEKTDYLVGRFFAVVDQSEPQLDTPALTSDHLIDIERLSDQLINMTTKDLVDLSEPTVVRPETTFPEKLNAFTFDEVEKMRTTDLAQSINLKSIWPRESIETHLEVGHQNLDTLLLARSLRDAISVEQPVVKDGSSLATEALAYNFFLSEMHGAISKSRTPEELLVNFDKAYTNVTGMQPDFFAKVKGENELNKQCEVFNAFKKASHAHIVIGMSANDALTHGLKDNQQFMTHYDDVALEVGLKEKLYVQEKPFAYYLNGFTLNVAEPSEVEGLSAALMARTGQRRDSDFIVYTHQETTNSAIHKDILNTLNAISPLDYDVKDNTDQLQRTWGVDFSVGPQDKHYAQGYANIADGVLTQFHASLNEQVTKDQVGRGLSIQGGVPRDAENIKDIHLVDIAGGAEGSFQHFANRYVNQLVRRIEKEESKLMTPAELSQFSAVKEDYQGIVAMSQRFGYEPKTEAAKALLSVHSSLVGDTQPTNSTKALFEHSNLVVANKLQEVERNVDIHQNDHTGAYAKHYVSYMEARQDGALKNLAEKMRKMQTSNPDAPDMYHFVPAVDMLDKISNTSTISSKSAVDKFVEEFHKKNPQSSKDSIALMLNTAIAEKPDSIIHAQDYLASRASDKFISLLDQYAPEGIKGTDQFIENLNKYFGAKLGENLQIEQMQYHSDFGHNQEMEHKTNLITDPERTVTEINADKVVYNYLNASIGGDTNIMIKEPEKDNGLILLAEVLVAHDKDRKLTAVAEMKIEKELKKESSVELDQ